ncbi:MAG: hypothetical protein V4671_26345 [Armatimonadota bacterium]
MRLCTNCETMVDDPHAKLCPNCGAVLPGATVPPPLPTGPMMQMQRPPRESTGSQITRALLISLLVIIGIGVLLFFGLLMLCGLIGQGGGIH